MKLSVHFPHEQCRCYLASLVRNVLYFSFAKLFTDKVVRAVLTTLARVFSCVSTVCEGERAGEIE